MKFDIEDMRYFAEKHRGKYRTSGPHWSTIIRFPILFDEYEKTLTRAKAAEAQIIELERIICGMFPTWVAAIGYCDKRYDNLMSMKSCFNGKDNSITGEDLQLILSLVYEKGSE